jgi:hypothetical protein
MNDETVLYRERLPKYVFNGSRLRRRSILITQWIERALAVSFFIGSLYIIFIHAPNEKESIFLDYFGVLLIWMACISLIYHSERRLQKELDGSTATIIDGDRISIPPRTLRKILGKSEFVTRPQIDHVEICRGSATQYVASKNGIAWEDSTIEILIILKSGKKYRSGYKPPNTVREIMEVLRIYWSIRIEDSQSGMGKGVRYIGDKRIGEYSYEEIMNMNLFEWQE